MTNSPSLPPVSYALSNVAGAVNVPRAMTAAPDFQSQLKALFKPPLLPPVPASAQVISESTTEMARRPDVEAMLQLLAWRKVTFNAPSKIGRSVPGALASDLAVLDHNFADHTGLEAPKMINLACAYEQIIVLCPEHIKEPTAWRADSCGGDFLGPDESCEGYECGLNASAIAVALSGSTLIWIPSEIVRAPLQSPRFRIWRRSKPPSAERYQPDHSDADVDNNHR